MMIEIQFLQTYLQSNLLNIRFASFQIDNLLHPSGEYDYPVVMCNKDIPKLSKSITSSNSAWDLEKIFKISQVNPISSIHIQFYDNNESHLDVETLVLNLCSIRLYIEDTFVNVLLDLMDECIPSNLVYKSNFSIKRISCQNGLVLIPKTVVCQSLAESIRIRSIRIAPLNVLLSIHTCIR